MMARMLRLSMGLLAASLLSVVGLHATTGQEVTQLPGYEGYINVPSTGLTIDGMISSPFMSVAAGTQIRVNVQRLTFESGVKFELDYPGPVEYYVDQGEMGVTWTKESDLLLGYSGEVSNGAGLSVVPGDENTLGPGYSVFSESGQLGLVRNAGNGTLVVIAMLIVPYEKWAVTGDPNATPMNEIEIGS
jgi:hypothetical protein